MKPPLLQTGESVPTPPRQARSRRKRQDLIDAARSLFAEQGYEAASIGEITARAGTAAGAFYTYFPSKRQLLVELMSELLARLSAVDLQPSRGGRIELRNFLTRVLRTDLDNYGVIRAWQEASLSDPKLGALRVAIEQWTGARILRVFQRLRKAPRSRPQVDVAAFARMMDRHFWSLLARGASLPRRAFDREVRMSADVIYCYLFRDTPSRRLRGRRAAAPEG